MLIYPDANVLIALASALPSALDVHARLMMANASYVTSNLLELETVPSTVYVGKTEQTAILRRFFHRWPPKSASKRTIAVAHKECEILPLGSMDALHLAAAHQQGAEYFITLEKPSKPMHRTKLVKVVHLDNVIRKLKL